MGRPRQPYTKTIYQDKPAKKWYGRLRIRRPDGTIKSIVRQARSKSDAWLQADKLEQKFIAVGLQVVDAQQMTFGDLAARYMAAKCVPAVYIGERKVSGLKHPDKTKSRVKRLVDHFGAHLVQQITYGDLETYKAHLIALPTQHKKQRSIYDVNHQLRQMRILINFAIRNRWIRENPFHTDDPLINAADEMPRQRPQRPGEADRLLAVCTGRRAHLRVLILLGADTALRPTEMLRLKPAQIDFAGRQIIATATTTKTNRQRAVPLTTRLAKALDEWLRTGLRDWLFSSTAHGDVDHDELLANPGTTIFAGIKSVKTAWKSACAEAGIADLKLKDLRHWATTDFVAAMAAAGIGSEHGMKITGHTQERTFRRYITTDESHVDQIRESLESLRAKERR